MKNLHFFQEVQLSRNLLEGPPFPTWSFARHSHFSAHVPLRIEATAEYYRLPNNLSKRSVLQMASGGCGKTELLEKNVDFSSKSF